MFTYHVSLKPKRALDAICKTNNKVHLTFSYLFEQIIVRYKSNRNSMRKYC